MNGKPLQTVKLPVQCHLNCLAIQIGLKLSTCGIDGSVLKLTAYFTPANSYKRFFFFLVMTQRNSEKSVFPEQSVEPTPAINGLPLTPTAKGNER